MSNHTISSGLDFTNAVKVTPTIDWAKIVDNSCSTATAGVSNVVDSNYVTDKLDFFKIKVDDMNKKPDVREDTATKLDVISGNIYVNRYKNGFSTGRKLVMSDIKDVTVYHNTVIVTFADNTKTVAAMDPEDKFDLEQGISICITKKLLGDNGTSIYNKLIKRAFKVMNNNEAARIKAEEEKAEKKRRDEAYIAKKKKIKAKKREAEIELRKEAIIRAMREMNEMH